MTQRVVNYTYGTGNPVLPNGSIDVRDGVDNLQSFDVFMGAQEDTYNQRDGSIVKTLSGAVKEIGFPIVGDFTTGCTVTASNQGVQVQGGSVYRWDGVIPVGGKVIPPSSTPEGTGGISPAGDWVDVGDASVRSELTSHGSTLEDIARLKVNLTGGGSLASPYGVINVDLPPYNGNLGAAIDAAPAGSTLWLGNRDYNIVGKFSLSAYLTKQLKFYGAGMPLLAPDKSRFVTGTGTVIQGSLVTVVDGIEVFNMGVDVGPYVVDTLAAGAHQEGLVISNEIHNDPFNFSKYSKDCHIGNIKVLLKDATSDPATAKHGVLLENLYGGSHGYIECIGGYHGFVYKSYGVQPKGPVVAYGQQGQAVIFKSDANSICGRYKNGNLVLGKTGFTTQVGVITQAGVGSAWVDISVHVSLLNIANRGFLNVMDSPAVFCSDFDVMSLSADGCVGVTYEVPQNAIRWRLGPHSISNTTYGVGVVAGAYQTQIDDGATNNASQYSYVFNADVTHGKLLCGNSGVADVLTSVPVDRNIIKSTTGVTNIESTYNAKALVVMRNGWSNAAFNAEQANNTLSLNGFLSGGTNDLVAVVENSGYRPRVRKDFPVVIENSDLTRTVTAGYITPGGEIYVYGGGAIGPAGGKVFLDSLFWLFV